jgi:hypothetical protein
VSLSTALQALTHLVYHILQLLCNTVNYMHTQCPDAAVRKVAYECISNIASMYYSKLQPYMHVLFDLTIKTAKEDEVCL